MSKQTNETVAEATEKTVEQPVEEVVEEGLEFDETNQSNDDEEFERRVNERINEILPKKINRERKKIEREYENKYGQIEPLLTAGTGTENLNDAVNSLKELYKEKGIDVPTRKAYSNSDLKILANAEADDIIDEGYDAIVEETNRLANIPKDNMSERDKLIFTKLAKERRFIEEEKELASIGVTKENLEDKEFKKLRDKLNPNLSLKEQYDLFQKINPKKEFKKMGSMKNGATSNFKDFYTYEEASRLTDDDYKNNPKLYEIVEKSALQWK